MFGVFSAEAEPLVEENRPEREKLFVPANGFRFALAVCSRDDLFAFVSHQRPQLPALQSVAVAEMEKRIKIIFRYDVFLARLTVERKQNKTNLILEKPVLQEPVKRNQRRVVQTGVR